MKNYFFLVLILLPLLSIQAEEPLIVQLQTEVQRSPIYLPAFINHDLEFKAQYIQSLEEVLQFDLNYNGYSYLIPRTKRGNELTASDSFDASLDPNVWNLLNIYAVIKAQIKDKKISILIYSLDSSSIKQIESAPLTGNLRDDRRQIHQLSDAIVKILFNQEGVASTKLLFTKKSSNSNEWLSDVWEADYDGANERQLTKNIGYVISPIYTPPKPGFSSGSFLFVSYKTGQPKIYCQSLNNKETQRLSLLRGNQLMPAFSPRRDTIAFISDVTGNPDLFVMPFNPETGEKGKPYQIFAAYQAVQGSPTFSPDGTKIAFVSNKDGIPRIYVMSVPQPGTSIKNLKTQLITKYHKESTAPAWSPDGTKLAYCAITKGIRQIWIYDFEKDEEKQLTQGPGNKENPTWAPNSLHLVFNSSDSNASELYLLNLNQKETVKISQGLGEKRFPSWER